MRLMLDLFSGTKQASAAMRERGWEVVCVDIDPALEPDIVADLKTWHWEGRRPDLIWLSPPCDDFAREFMPWTRTGRAPDLSLIKASKRIVKEAKPCFWILENVKGAIKYLGQPVACLNPYFLWGFFPDLGIIKFERNKKERMSSRNKLQRAAIPYELSLAVALAIENARTLWDLDWPWEEVEGF
jgi:hypothetical protein